MSLVTRQRIKDYIETGVIEIEPRPKDEHIGPNSVDLHLHPDLKVYAYTELDAYQDNPTESMTIPEHGMMLYPGEFYLARTIERTYTPKHVPYIGGRSSTGRLGIEVHCTAGLGDIGFNGTWTLEISVKRPVRVYPNMRIAQLWFHEVVIDGELPAYTGRYQNQVHATASRMHRSNGDNS